jgi:hypothetical protein
LAGKLRRYTYGMSNWIQILTLRINFNFNFNFNFYFTFSFNLLFSPFYFNC